MDAARPLTLIMYSLNCHCSLRSHAYVSLIAVSLAILTLVECSLHLIVMLGAMARGRGNSEALVSHRSKERKGGWMFKVCVRVYMSVCV